MTSRARLFTPLAVILAVVSGLAVPAAAASSALAMKIDALGRMMLELAPESASSAAKIRSVYEAYMDFLVLDGYDDIEGALTTGALVPLPVEPRFNLVPRLDGPHPIGEMDLDNQESYVSARPFTVGLALEIASRVHSSPLEITSLVRHNEYQDALRITNTNATTSVPMHTMGLAVDIALVNTPLATAYEVRDVLLDMQEAGDLLFIGERHQLVFHVVPQPSRLGHFLEVYSAALGVPGASRAAQVIAQPQPAHLVEVSEMKPQVTTEVISILPADESLWPEWFAWEKAARAPAAPAPPSPAAGVMTAFGLMRSVLPMLAGVIAAVFVQFRMNAGYRER